MELINSDKIINNSTKDSPTKEFQNIGIEKINPQQKDISSIQINSPLWFSVSETAKLGGVTTKTIRRAISSKLLTYKVVKNRYLIDWQTMLIFLFSNKKLRNKLDQKGIGQYIEKWK